MGSVVIEIATDVQINFRINQETDNAYAQQGEGNHIILKPRFHGDSFLRKKLNLDIKPAIPTVAIKSNANCSAGV